MTQTPDWDQLLTEFRDGSQLAAVLDDEWNVRSATPELTALLGLDFTPGNESSAMEIVHPADHQKALEAMASVTEFEGLHPPSDYRVRNADGHWSSLDLAGEAISHGAILLHVNLVDERRRAEMLAVEQIEILETAVPGANIEQVAGLLVNMLERHVDGSIVIIHLIENGKMISVHSGAVDDAIANRLVGVPASAIQTVAPNLSEAAQRGFSYFEPFAADLPHWRTVLDGTGIASVVSTPAQDPNGNVNGHVEVLRFSAERPRNEELSVHGLVARLAGLLVDRYSFEQTLERAALNDALTGLGNRLRLTLRIEELANVAAPFSMIAVDLDQFTWVNNNLGHQAGDELLVSVAKRFSSVLPPGAEAFRPGGDEFVIVVPGERRSEAVVEIGQHLLESLGEPISVGPERRKVRASLGVATCRRGDSDPTRILARADAAMYAAKRNGGSGIRLFDADIGMKVSRKMELADQLGAAIANGQMGLVFQPMFNLASKHLAGVEALVRWDHPTLGLVGPDEFVPIAEESQLILELDEWVINEASTRLNDWYAHRDQLEEFGVWVNLSARTFERPGLVEVFQSFNAAIPLSLELTERDSFASFGDASDAIRRLTDAGHQIHIDDFGTGRASLHRLAEFDVSGVKIDRAFVDGMIRSDRYREVVQSIVELGQTLNISVTAEGIESLEQLEALTELGCGHGQGYLLARPMLRPALETRFGQGLDLGHALTISSGETY